MPTAYIKAKILPFFDHPRYREVIEMDDKTRNKISFYLEQILLSAHDISTQDVFIRKQLRMVNSYVTEIQRLLK